MNIKYEGETVEIKNKEEWIYKTVNSKVLVDVNPKLFNEIQLQVENYVDNKKELDKIEREKAEIERLEKQKIQVEDFKREVKKEFPNLIKKYKVEFENPESERYNFNSKTLKIGLKEEKYTRVEITFNDEVYRGYSWHTSKTNSKWIMEFDYKNRRYTTLEKAIKKGLEKLEEYKKEQELKDIEEREKRIAKDAMKAFAEDNGYEFYEQYHSRRDYRGYACSGWNTYYMIKGSVKADLLYDSKTNKVKITNYVVTKENITLEDLKKVL